MQCSREQDHAGDADLQGLPRFPCYVANRGLVQLWIKKAVEELLLEKQTSGAAIH
jgi:hypothetical protein